MISLVSHLIAAKSSAVGVGYINANLGNSGQSKCCSLLDFPSRKSKNKKKATAFSNGDCTCGVGSSDDFVAHHQQSYRRRSCYQLERSGEVHRVRQTD